MANLDLSPENLKARFHELSAQMEPLLAKRVKINEELAAITNGEADLSLKAATKREETLRQQSRELQDQLAPIEYERAQVARLLQDRGDGLAKTGPIDNKLTALRDKATD